MRAEVSGPNTILVVDAFLSCKVGQNRVGDAFFSLDCFRRSLNITECFGDFVWDGTRALLQLCDAADKDVGAYRTFETIHDVETARLLEQAKKLKSPQLTFFNFDSGQRLRLDVLGHPLRVNKVAWCGLYGLLNRQGVGGPPKHMCAACNVHLCIKGKRHRNNCWREWHRKGTL